MALVNEGSDSFTYHLPATQHFGMSRTYSPAAERYRALWLMLISRPAEGRKLSWEPFRVQSVKPILGEEDRRRWEWFVQWVVAFSSVWRKALKSV